jgi:hypothetical protein
MNYTSSARFLGLPLLDIRVGPLGPGTVRGVARGWIAIGDVAVGAVLAVGGAAFGTIAVGGLAVGLVSFAGLAAGLLAVGGGAIGVWSLGGAAVALHAAMGGLAVAGSYALGGVAVAPHANDAVAGVFFSTGEVFPALRALLPYSRWLLLLIALPLWPLLRRTRPVP